MPAKINTNSKLSRVRTGLYSLDWACASRDEPGFPVRVPVEISGRSGSGKSTLGYAVSGVIANSNGHEDPHIQLADIEGIDPLYLETAFASLGYEGSVDVLPLLMNKTVNGVKKEVMIPHEDMVQALADGMWNDDSIFGAMFDSVSAFTPIQERKGDIGEAIMGRRAKSMAQFMRRVNAVLMGSISNRTAIIINHKYRMLGSRGSNTAGGEVIKNLSGLRLEIWRQSGGSLEDDVDGADLFIAEGKVTKLRYGGRGGGFQFIIVPDYGLHPGLTALYDAKNAGLVSFTAGRVRDAEGEYFGMRKDLVKSAMSGETGWEEQWLPFYSLLEKETERRYGKEILHSTDKN